MKVTKAQLKQIIKEEILALDEKWSWSKFKKDIGFGPKPEPEPEVEPEPEPEAEPEYVFGKDPWLDDFYAQHAPTKLPGGVKKRADRLAAEKKAADAAEYRAEIESGYHETPTSTKRKSDFERWQSDEDPDPAYNYMTRMEESIYKKLKKMIRGKSEKA